MKNKNKKLATWEPSLGNIYDGKVLWDPNDMIEFEVTLYKSINEDKFEEKEWTLVIESVSIDLRLACVFDFLVLLKFF